MVALSLLAMLLVAPGSVEDQTLFSSRPISSPSDTLLDPRLVVLNELLEEESAEQVDVAELIAMSLDLNRATSDELARIPGISLAAIDSVVARRRQSRFTSIAELTRVGITDTDRLLLTAFTHIVDSPLSRPRVRARSSTRWSRRLEQARGYSGTEPAYLGSPDRIQSRTTITLGEHTGALTFDKPSGARLAWSPSERLYGFDRIHGYAAFRRGQVARLTLGDYRAEYGQGLTVWGGASFGRGREPVRGVMRSSRGLNGTASTMDDRLLRGVALTLRPVTGVSLDAFASSRRVDAAIDTVSIDDGEVVLARRVARTSHRTELEFDRRNALGEKVVGTAVTLRYGAATVGSVVIRGTYEVPLAPGDRPDTRYFRGGRHFVHYGVHSLVRLPRADLFGEVSLDAQRMIAGVRVGDGQHFEAIASVRSYSRRSDNPFAAGFASRSYPLSNERGGYVGIRVRIQEATTVLAFTDLAYHPWVRYQLPRATSSSDQFLEVRHAPRSWWEFNMSLRRRTLDARMTADSVAVVMIRREVRQVIRIDSKVEASPALRLHTRAERAVSASPTNDVIPGYLIYHEISARASRYADVNARISHFDIDGFDSRVYAYERDVIGAFTTHMYTGSGRRIYGLITVRPHGRTSVQFRLARTWLDGVEHVGSGAALLEGNTTTDLSLLVMHRL